MQRFPFFSLALAGLAACDAPSAPNSGETSRAQPSFNQILLNQSFPVAGTLANPCPPEEDVAFEGRLHVLVKGEPDQFTVHTNGQSVQGVGVTSGDRYVLTEQEKSQTQVSGTDQTQLFDFRFHMVRQGSADNFFYRALIVFTLDLDGEILGADVIREDIQCRG
jgi:hypothetical protein